MKQLYLGIDLGTSAMKIVLIDEKRQILRHATESYTLSSPEEGWNEINQENWFESLIKGVKTVLRGYDTSLLKSIGITGQMHTIVVLDKKGDYIRPAMMWNDLRSKDLISELKENIVSFEEGDYLSRTISIGSPAANLYWMKQNEPENYAKIGKFLIGADYLVYRLTGHFGTDYCEASTSCLYEINHKRWSKQMREFLELDGSVYPEVHESMYIMGTVIPEVAELLNIPQTVTVLTGTGDNPATAISTGCLTGGYPVISLGTSGVFVYAQESKSDDALGKKILFSFDNKRFYHLVQGSVQSNGRTLAWWSNEILEISDFTYIDKCVDVNRGKNNNIMFYPHLAGEKTIYGDPSIRGAFIGLSIESKREDMTYAVLEGLCFAFRELAEKMNLPLENYGSIKVVGGGAKSKVWLQMFADVLNLPIEKMDGMIGASFGIALLALFRNLGKEKYSEMTENTIVIRYRFEPNPEMVEIYNKKYRNYKRMHDGLKYIMSDEEDTVS